MKENLIFITTVGRQSSEKRLYPRSLDKTVAYGIIQNRHLLRPNIMHVLPLQVDIFASCQKSDMTHRKQVPLFHGVAQVMKLESAKSYL